MAKLIFVYFEYHWTYLDNNVVLSDLTLLVRNLKGGNVIYP